MTALSASTRLAYDSSEIRSADQISQKPFKYYIQNTRDMYSDGNGLKLSPLAIGSVDNSKFSSLVDRDSELRKTTITQCRTRTQIGTLPYTTSAYYGNSAVTGELLDLESRLFSGDLNKSKRKSECNINTSYLVTDKTFPVPVNNSNTISSNAYIEPFRRDGLSTRNAIKDKLRSK